MYQKQNLFNWNCNNNCKSKLTSTYKKETSKMKKITNLFTVFMILAGFTSCINVNGTKAEDNNSNTSVNSTVTSNGIDYQNYLSDYSIIVRNNSAENVVCFKGSPRPENLISGAKAFDTTKLKHDAGLFNSNSDFVLFCVKESDYLANKNNLEALENKPFCRLYCFYNTATANNTIYEISKYLGGELAVTLNNNTRYNIELRADSIHGETIGYTQARTIKTTFSLADTEEIYLFPVFKKFDTNRGEILSVYPKFIQGQASGEAMYTRLVFDNETTSYTIDARQWTDATNVSFAHTAAYIRIINSSNVAISVFNGSNSNELLTQQGGKGIKSGSESIFTLNMPAKIGSGENDFAYEESISTSQLKIGDAMKQYFLTKDGNTPFTYEAGKEYQYTITGATIYDLNWESTPEVVELEF